MSWQTYRHRCQVRVRFGDTDPYGIVYFVSYFRYCHRGIEEFLRSLGLPPEETFRNVKEGFGLPIVEANAVGRPVITSRLYSMPEVGGDAACYVDSYDVGSIRAAVEKIIHNADYRQQLIENGYRNVKRFQLPVIAAQYAVLYRRLRVKG